jgi:hypothetical protein
MQGLKRTVQIVQTVQPTQPIPSRNRLHFQTEGSSVRSTQLIRAHAAVGMLQIRLIDR